jgi:hypothetical protein
LRIANEAVEASAPEEQCLSCAWIIHDGILDGIHDGMRFEIRSSGNE